jgi:hypothetical protein
MRFGANAASSSRSAYVAAPTVAFCSSSCDEGDEDIDGPVTKGFGIPGVAGGGGFGSKRVGGSKEILTPTRKTTYREVRGQYARVLAAKSLSYEKMRERGTPTTFDIYVRASNSDIFWFVGKLNHDQSKIDAKAALRLELNLIREYAKSLRPRELSGPLAVHFELEVFTTPGNNEMNVAQNKIALTKFDSFSSRADGGDGDGADDDTAVGFEPEIYQGGEEGFRVTRNADGSPKKGAFEINQKSPAELEAMQAVGQELERKNVVRNP